MAIINLRDIYPHYEGDSFVEIPDDVLKVIEDCERREKAYKRYLRYYKVCSLDDSTKLTIEHEIMDTPQTPDEAYNKKMMIVFLHRAIKQLPEKQAERICLHFFYGLNFTEIAKVEGVDESTVRKSIGRGLHMMRNFLKSFF